MISKRSSPSNQRLGYLIFAICVFISAWAWFHFTYPKFSLIDLTITRAQALQIATDYIQGKDASGINAYKRAIVFDVDNQTDRYLQKAIGLNKEDQFLKENDYGLYFWSIRFFKEQQKEEYRVILSSSTGEILSYSHLLDEATARPEISEANAQEIAKNFLKDRFKYDFNEWVFNTKVNTKFDHRIEYTFSWEKKNIYIPWSVKANTGGGKILSTVVVTGQEIAAYSKQGFSVPEQFGRYVEGRKESGRNLGLVSNIGSLCFVIGAIWIILLRRNHLAMNVTKGFYLKTVIVLFLLSILSVLNNWQSLLFSYPTTQPFAPFFIRQVISTVLERFLFFICFIIPCLAGELLRFEIFPKKKHMGMLHYVTTTFFSRDVARTIFLAYCFAIIMIGLQTAIFQFGYKFCDVWMEQGRLSRFSSADFPFFGVLILGANASITEETFYRLFGINISFKIFRNPIVGILIPSVIWGLGHTSYIVFPFWFRGLEVTLLGIFTAFIYLRFGLICVIVQHFLFDAFWASAPYVFGKSSNIDFWMSLVVLGLPFIFAISAFILNRVVQEKPLEWRLNGQQRYNLDILKGYIELKNRNHPLDANQLRAQLIHNGWDVAVIDVAFHQLNIPLSVDHTISDP